MLVVDDDDVLRASLAELLARRGWHVEVARDGGEALRTLGQAPFDALLLDLQMEPVNGWAVIDRLELLPRAPVTLVLSGFLDIPATVRAIRAGVADVIQKGIRPELLVERLEALVPVLPTRRARASAPPGAHDAASRLLGATPQMQLVREQIRSVARYRDLPVLVLGETGTGKELVAEAIHELTGCGPFFTLNCAAIPESLFESELFGHEHGAFTGAQSARVGLLEAAGQGTVFLDEIGEMPPILQPKLLRVLETRRFRRLGSNRDLTFSARVVSATNQPRTAGGALRPDLYFRLAGFEIALPPLRERADDISILARHFLEQFSLRYPDEPRRLTSGSLETLKAHAWPGNVRELRAVVERAAVISSGGELTIATVRSALLDRAGSAWNHSSSGTFSIETAPPSSASYASLPALEKDLILGTYERCGRNVSHAARQLGIPRSTMRDRLRRFGVR
ncbi:MAG: sigma-54 dependent transcriptional regulator [Polyangiaceae bacterium]